MMNSRTIALFSIAASLMALCACSPGDANGKHVTHLEGSRAIAYSSTSELASASSAIAVVTAGPAHAERIKGVPFTTTEMRVLSLTSGALPKEFQLIQIGELGSSEEMPIVAEGDTYLAFLAPFENATGVVPGVYVTVGAAAGLYHDEPAGYARMDPLSPALPPRISKADVTALAAGR
jgi:hypothetical protein